MYDIFLVDHGHGNELNYNHRDLYNKFPHIQILRSTGNTKGVMLRALRKCRTKKFWLIDCYCDYKEFNFTYDCPPWEDYQIHCWPSNDEKFGDTFLVPVEAEQKLLDAEILDWYEHINYNHESVFRYNHDLIIYEKNVNIVDAIKDHKFESPYTLFVQEQLYEESVFLLECIVTPKMWREKDRLIYNLNTSGSACMVPKDCKQYISEQVYDYPYIQCQNAKIFDEKPLDVVFISNGELNASKNLERLQNLCPRTVKHIDGINSRTGAYQAAAKASTTDWFLAVFAKCYVDEDFDWNWQPDRLQGDKHWIFDCYNPVNELTYGHMAVIAYNKNLTLCSEEIPGMDFTLAAKHGHKPMLSCNADYEEGAYSVWRTSFRECLKLRDSVDIDSKYRLKQWTSVGNGEYGEWSIKGAKDAIAFTDDPLLSYEWKWCKNYFNKTYINKAVIV
jgi:hypothetical protein